MKYKDECDKLIKRLGYDASVLSELEDIFEREFDVLKKNGYSVPKIRLIVGLEYTCKNVEIENLTLEQIEAIKRVVDRLYGSKEITNQNVNEYLKSLIKVGLMPIPRLEKLHEITI